MYIKATTPRTNNTVVSLTIHIQDIQPRELFDVTLLRTRCLDNVGSQFCYANRQIIQFMNQMYDSNSTSSNHPTYQKLQAKRGPK